MTTITRAPTSDTGTAGDVAYSSGSTGYTLVNDHPDSADPLTTYVQLGTTANSAIWFGFASFSVPTGATVNSIVVNYYDEEPSNGQNQAAARLLVGGTHYAATTHQVATTTTSRTDTWTTNPDTSSAWTVDQVNGTGANNLTAFGVIGTDSNPVWRLGSIEIVVDYDMVASVTPTQITSTTTFGTASVSSVSAASVTATIIASTASFGTATVAGTGGYRLYVSTYEADLGTSITGAQIVAGQDPTSSAAVWADDISPSSGTNDWPSESSGLTAGTAYRDAFVGYDGVDYTAVSVTDSWSTDAAAASVTPALIASTLSFGTASVTRTAVAAVTPALIGSALTFGTATVARTAVATVTATLIDPTATFGTATVARTSVATVTATLIDSTAAVNAPTVVRTAVATVTTARIESTVTFGTATVARIAIVPVTATLIPSAVTFGTAVVSADGLAAVAPSIISSTLTFGTAAVTRTSVATVTATIIASTVSFGTATVARTSVATVTATRIEPTASIGTHTVNGTFAAGVSATRIESTLAFGTAVLDRFAVVELAPQIIVSGLVFGTPTVVRDGVVPVVEEERRGGGSATWLQARKKAQKRLALQLWYDYLTQKEPAAETKRAIKEIKAGRPIPGDIKLPKGPAEVSATKLAAEIIRERLFIAQ
jgi:hypothetical protein